jgi:hypothetical protein
MSLQPFSTDATKVYQVQSMSGWNTFVFVLAAPLSLFAALGISIMFGGSLVVFLVSIAAVFGLMILLFRYVQQQISVTLGPGTISIHYLRSPFFDSVSDMELTPADVDSYKYDNFNGARFTLYLKDGRKFKVLVGNIGKRKAVEEMAEHIIAMLTDTQRTTTNTAAAPPRRLPTYADGTKGLVLAILMIALMVAMVIAMVFYPQNHKTSDTVRGFGAIFTCLAFVIHVFNLRRKARKEGE